MTTCHHICVSETPQALAHSDPGSAAPPRLSCLGTRYLCAPAFGATLASGVSLYVRDGCSENCDCGGTGKRSSTRIAFNCPARPTIGAAPLHKTRALGAEPKLDCLRVQMECAAYRAWIDISAVFPEHAAWTLQHVLRAPIMAPMHLDCGTAAAATVALAQACARCSARAQLITLAGVTLAAAASSARLRYVLLLLLSCLSSTGWCSKDGSCTANRPRPSRRESRRRSFVGAASIHAAALALLLERHRLALAARLVRC